MLPQVFQVTPVDGMSHNVIRLGYDVLTYTVLEHCHELDNFEQWGNLEC